MRNIGHEIEEACGSADLAIKKNDHWLNVQYSDGGTCYLGFPTIQEYWGYLRALENMREGREIVRMEGSDKCLYLPGER